jgi:hypothetical protein
MAGTLPTVRSGHVGLYPLQRSSLLTVSIQRFLNFSEQRFQKHAALEQFVLAYKGLVAADRDALKEFYATTKGQYVSSWSFTIGASTYPSLMFTDDNFVSVESDRPNLYDVTLKVRQVAPGGAPGASGATWPLTSTGAITQRPFAQTVRYRTTENTNPNGPSYSAAWFDGGWIANPTLGWPGFPTRGLMAWKLEFPCISDTDMQTLEAFFIAMNGRWQTFSFTDPDSQIIYTSVRFDMDSFTYNYTALGSASTTVLLTETYTGASGQ